ncbi:MAG: hypothetical protein D6776_06240, partial [Planctomycetota bacterium]
PGWLLEEVCARNARFTLVHADAMPKVAIGPIAVRRLGPTLWRLEADLRNDGIMDSRTALAERTRVIPPDEVVCAGSEGAGAVRVLWAAIARDPLAPRYEPVERRPERVPLPTLRGRSALRAAWLVEGPEGARVRITLRSPKGGLARSGLVLHETAGPSDNEQRGR